MQHTILFPMGTHFSDAEKCNQKPSTKGKTRCRATGFYDLVLFPL
jgi:hypothetical protein